MSTYAMLMISLYIIFLAWLLWYILYIWLSTVPRIDIAINLIQFLIFFLNAKYHTVSSHYILFEYPVFSLVYFLCVKNLVYMLGVFFWCFHIQSLRTGSVCLNQRFKEVLVLSDSWIALWKNLNKLWSD